MLPAKPESGSQQRPFSDPAMDPHVQPGPDWFQAFGEIVGDPAVGSIQ